MSFAGNGDEHPWHANRAPLCTTIAFSSRTARTKQNGNQTTKACREATCGVFCLFCLNAWRRTIRFGRPPEIHEKSLFYFSVLCGGFRSFPLPRYWFRSSVPPRRTRSTMPTPSQTAHFSCPFPLHIKQTPIASLPEPLQPSQSCVPVWQNGHLTREPSAPEPGTATIGFKIASRRRPNSPLPSSPLADMRTAGRASHTDARRTPGSRRKDSAPTQRGATKPDFRSIGRLSGFPPTEQSNSNFRLNDQHDSITTRESPGLNKRTLVPEVGASATPARLDLHPPNYTFPGVRCNTYSVEQ
jgi:hypothetical protein